MADFRNWTRRMTGQGRWLRAALAMALVVAAAPAGAQDQALLARDSLWNSARLRGDTAALRPILADDWMLTHSDGRVQHKRDYLDELGSGRRSNAQVVNRGVTVRMYGSVAVVTGISEQSGVSNGQPWSGRFRFTRTWVRRDGAWLMVASHSSRCAEGVDC